MTRFFFVLACVGPLVVLGLAAPAHAEILFSSFGPFGEGGTSHGQTFNFGRGGSVFEVDSFLNVDGFDLNGPVRGTSAQLSIDPLPSGTLFDFAPSLNSDGTDLLLRYTFTNLSGSILPNSRFFLFLDAEIDVSANTFFNEAGSVFGTIGTGAGDPEPDSFEIDEPGFVFGDVFDNLLLGILDDTNALSASFPDDAAMALGFELGPLRPFDRAAIDILISDDGASLGNFALQHFDTDPLSPDTLTISGTAEVMATPEPSSWLLLAAGLAGLLGIRGRSSRMPNETSP